MKKHSGLIVLVASLTTFSVIAAPEKAPKEKRAESPQFLPGLNAVLQLTQPRKSKSPARTEMSNDEAFKAARTLPKGDASVTAEQREKARAVIEAANMKLREQVAEILTPDQAALVAKINTAYGGLGVASPMLPTGSAKFHHCRSTRRGGVLVFAS